MCNVFLSCSYMYRALALEACFIEEAPMRNRRWVLAAAAVVGLATGTISTFAQTYPSQTVRIVVPFGAGSITDILARLISEDASKKWGQQVIVENRPGLPGTVAVARAEPDGLTLMLTSNGHAAVGYINKVVLSGGGTGHLPGHHSDVSHRASGRARENRRRIDPVGEKQSGEAQLRVTGARQRRVHSGCAL